MASSGMSLSRLLLARCAVLSEVNPSLYRIPVSSLFLSFCDRGSLLYCTLLLFEVVVCNKGGVGRGFRARLRAYQSLRQGLDPIIG
jgi:hypothetical protein